MTDASSERAAATFTAAVVGAGVMGSAIAQTLATAGAEVRCTDTSPEQLRRAEDEVVAGRYGWETAVARGKVDAEHATAARARLTFTSDLDSAVDGAALVLEAIVEDLAAKLDCFRVLGRVAPEHAVLASNTSGFPIVALAAAAGRTETVLGWHWASPAQVRPFAEIVVTERTDPAVIEQVVGWASQCGKNPVVVRENPKIWGFVANRILFAALHEAQRIRDEGLATEEEIDTLVRDAYGWPFGPFAVVRGAAEGFATPPPPER